MKQTAGTLLYRQGDNEPEVLLVHPAGNYNRQSPWGIPKGELEPHEQLEAAARRETLEETGVEADELVLIGHIDYTKSRKRVYCFAGPAPPNCAPHCASWEIDCCEFLPLSKARQVIHRDQAAFLDWLVKLLNQQCASESPPP
jgi:predicted NUDIX family NTP pyrophosphohydrolase